MINPALHPCISPLFIHVLVCFPLIEDNFTCCFCVFPACVIICPTLIGLLSLVYLVCVPFSLCQFGFVPSCLAVPPLSCV